MSEREQTIAEINKAVSRFMGAGSETEYDRALSVLSDYAGTWIPFLLSELERAQEQNRKLIEERDFWKDEYAVTVAKENEKLREELQSAQAEVVQLREERDFWKGQYDKQVERFVFLGEMVERLREEASRYREEARRERECTEQIVAERDELIIENE